jgi:hypothetical protein
MLAKIFALIELIVAAEKQKRTLKETQIKGAAIIIPIGQK